MGTISIHAEPLQISDVPDEGKTSQFEDGYGTGSRVRRAKPVSRRAIFKKSLNLYIILKLIEQKMT